jgi:hypothetical protein
MRFVYQLTSDMRMKASKQPPYPLAIRLFHAPGNTH